MNALRTKLIVVVSLFSFGITGLQMSCMATTDEEKKAKFNFIVIFADTKQYTEEAVGKIKSFKDEPFFVYMAHLLPHVPLFRSEEFKGVSAAGIYGDVIEGIDWSVGQVLIRKKSKS